MTDFVDPYLDPTTGLLRNLVGARTKTELENAEADLVHARMLSLDNQGIPPTRDLSEFRAIHRHLFQDVYSWAGELRTVDIRKDLDSATYFTPVAMIGRAAGFTAAELAADNALPDMDREDFIKRLAHHYDQLNYIHPFREGNGRAQRAFWHRVAKDAGWRLNWLEVSGEINDKASRAAADQRDLVPLIEMFRVIVEPLE